MTRLLSCLTVVSALLASAGCKEDPPAPKPTPAPQAATQPAATQPVSGGKASEHPNRVELGTQTVGALQLKAAQDEPIKPGGEGAFDLSVTGGKPKAVRCWVGLESGEGSTKVKAEEETPDNWHAHVEIPNPLPAGSKFWAEVEPPSGEKFKVSFDLKT